MADNEGFVETDSVADGDTSEDITVIGTVPTRANVSKVPKDKVSISRI